MASWREKGSDYKLHCIRSERSDKTNLASNTGLSATKDLIKTTLCQMRGFLLTKNAAAFNLWLQRFV